jgi:hypothetical protein
MSLMVGWDRGADRASNDADVSSIGMLSDEQKARFEAIGPQRTSQLESLDVVHTTVRRHGVDPVGQVIRRLMSITR